MIHSYALQAFNIEYSWNSMSPQSSHSIPKSVKQILIDNFISIDCLREQFIQKSLHLFGEGWVWIVKDNRRLRIICTKNANSPISLGFQPILACNLWHASYNFDYGTSKLRYLEAWWNIINWNFVENNIK